MKNELQKIKEVLRCLARRRQWFRAWNGFFKGMFFAAVLWFVTTLAFKVLPFPFGIFDWLAVLVLLAMLCGLIAGAKKRETDLAVAQWIDDHLGLKEKLSAAIEFSKSSEWRALLIRDGAHCLDQIDPKKVLIYRLPKPAHWTFMLLLASVLLGFVPEYRSESYQEKQRHEAAIRDVGRRVSSFAKHFQEHQPPQMKPTEKAMMSMEELGKRLKSAKITRVDALGKIANVKEKIEDWKKTLGENPTLARMREAARSSSSASGVDALREKIKALQQKMAGNSGDPAALAKMKQGLKDLQKSAELGSSNAGMSAEMKQQMSEGMASLLQNAKDQTALLPDLQEAMAALEKGEIDRFLKSLESAQINLDKMLEMAKALQSLQSELAAKNLGEQLDKGQIPAAQNRILEMVDKLSSQTLSSESLAEMMSEIADALSPAADYGIVKQKLAQALKQGQAGEMADSAKSLKEAADELGKLMGQLGDLQAMIDSLEMLQKAEQCVGNGKCWGSGFHPKGNRAGSGVGTWADEETASYFPESSSGWDNSGIIQPEMDSRGHTDRGEGELSPGMLPSKVKGQFTPGAPMPSITLKGVSVRGESGVEIEEAMNAAQSHAQRAISQQKVPRAYQQAVRSYFDDFAE